MTNDKTLRTPVALWRQLRPHQWSKNVLLLVPLVAAHDLSRAENWLKAFFALVVFSLLASSVYIFNDLCDLSSDRAHPTKKFRPLASGALNSKHAIALMFLLLGASILLNAQFLNPAFWAWCSIYLVVNLAYSLKLKKLLAIDVVCLASLYTLRIVAGGAATGTMVSYWLVTFSVFIFLSLAFVKRVSELLKVAGEQSTGRFYNQSDIYTILALGAGCAYSAVLVLALYLHSSDVLLLYKNPMSLWMLLPLLIYWLTRIWILGMRQLVHDDPVIFALRDKVTWIVAGLGILILVAGSCL